MDVNVIMPYILISILWGAAAFGFGKIGWCFIKALREEKRRTHCNDIPRLPDIDEPPKTVTNRMLMEDDYRRRKKGIKK